MNMQQKLLVSLLCAGVSVSAFAHSHLKSAVPAANSIVTESPANVSLTFAEPVMLMGFKVTDGSNKPVPLSYKLTSDMSKTFSIPLPKLANGKYHVAWVGMGNDGHNVPGQYVFSIKAK